VLPGICQTRKIRMMLGRLSSSPQYLFCKLSIHKAVEQGLNQGWAIIFSMGHMANRKYCGERNPA